MYYVLGEKNKYYTLYSLIRKDIMDGKFRPGEKLPSKRELAKSTGVSLVTVTLALEQLLSEGYVKSVERKGYFAERVSPAPPAQKKSEPAPQKEQKKYAVDLVNGSTPPSLFPFTVWAKLMRGVLADRGDLLNRVPAEGDWELRRAVSDCLYRTRGVTAPPERIIIGAGAEHLYGLIVQICGRDKVYAVENPGYTKISSSYSLNGARVVPVSVTATGISLDELHSSGADVVHISPAHQFPTGVITPAFVRLKLSEWAKEGRWIVEDDYDSEFTLSGKPLHTLVDVCPERVIYVNTFSKTLAPSLRIAYMLLPEKLYGEYKRLFSSAANVVPLFEQRALAAFLNGGYFERHINRLKNRLRSIRGEIKQKIASLGYPCRIFDTGGGSHFLAYFPGAESDEFIKSRAEELSVKIKCLGDYLLTPKTGYEKYAVINYSGLESLPDLK